MPRNSRQQAAGGRRQSRRAGTGGERTTVRQLWFFSPRSMAVLVSSVCGMGLFAVGGCSELINPYRDDLPATTMISTASARRVREAGPAGEVRQRGWSASLVQLQDPGVSHWPLWWEDFVEDSGSDDGQFAWTWCDYLCVVYGPARQVVNTVAFPVSMVVDPPGSIRCSDGVISMQTFGLSDHDSVACGGVAIPPDLIEAYEQSAQNLHTSGPPTLP